MKEGCENIIVKLEQLLNECELEPLDILIAFKEIVSPNSFANKEDLKELICKYIDEHMIHSIY